MRITLRKNEGFTLVELLVVVAITGVLGYMISTYFAGQNKQTAKTDFVSIRDSIVDNLRQTIASSDAIARSRVYTAGNYPTNTALRNCLENNAASCTDNASTPVVMTLVDSADRVVAAPSSATGLGKRYSPSGSPCADNAVSSAACPFVAQASFRARCAALSGTCEVAETLEVRFTLSVDDAGFLATHPLNPVTGSFVHFVSNL